MKGVWCVVCGRTSATRWADSKICLMCYPRGVRARHEKALLEKYLIRTLSGHGNHALHGGCHVVE